MDSCQQVPAADYLRLLQTCNCLEVTKWIFFPGMLYTAPDAWWGRRLRRHQKHEGLDIIHYLSKAGRLKALDAGAAIPAMLDGQVAGIIRDFIGTTILLRHTGIRKNNCCFYSIYAHVTPFENITVGITVSKGSLIAQLAGQLSPKPQGPPPHLHLSGAWVEEGMMQVPASWKALSCSPEVTFIDPLLLAGESYSVMQDTPDTP